MGTETCVKGDRIRFSGDQIAKAIIYHLIDAQWFTKPCPPALVKWLNEQLPADQKYSFKRIEWEETKSSTQRMLWLMVSARIDPFEFCRFKTDDEAKSMHQRFTNIIQSWYPPK